MNPTKTSSSQSREAVRLRWRRQKAAQRRRRSEGGFFAQLEVDRLLLNQLRTFVRLFPDDDLSDPRTASDILAAAIEQGARLRVRVLELEEKVLELEGKTRRTKAVG